MFWETDAQAALFVNSDDVNQRTSTGSPTLRPALSPRGPGSSAEGRPLTQAECRRARNYGDKIMDIRRRTRWTDVRHPIWDVIEVGCPFTGRPTCINPAQAWAAVWHTLIAGARGIEYFQPRSAAPTQPPRAARHACYQPMIDMVTSVDAQIKSIAPALNGPKLTSGYTASRVCGRSRSGTAHTSTSWRARWKTPVVEGTSRFRASARHRDGARRKPGAAGQRRLVHDSFADGNAVHIYRIDGGSTCGLN